MTTPFAALRDTLGDAALGRLSGLSRRDVQRIAAGEATLHADTGARVREGIAEAARVAGVPTAADALAVMEAIFARLPSAGPMQVRVGLALWRRGRAWALRDLCETLGGTPSATGPHQAVTSLARVGLVAIEPGGDHHRAKQARWLGA